MPAQVIADCSDRTLTCVLGANVVYDSSTETATKVRTALPFHLHMAHIDVLLHANH